MKAKVILIVVLALLIPLKIQAQDDAPSWPENPCWAYGDRLDPETGQCTFSTGLLMDIQYPPLPGFAAEIVQDFINRLQASMVRIFSEDFRPADDERTPWRLAIWYDSYEFSETIVSFNFRVWEGVGTHANAYFHTFIFDLENERMLTLDDLFREDVDLLETIVPLIQENLKEQFAGSNIDMDWLEGGTSHPYDYQNVVLTAEDMIFFFARGEIGPAILGSRQVNIPLSALNDILAPQFRTEEQTD